MERLSYRLGSCLCCLILIISSGYPAFSQPERQKIKEERLRGPVPGRSYREKLEDYWKEAAAARRNGLPRTEFGVLEKIYALASEAHDFREQSLTVKAMYRLSAWINWKSQDSVFKKYAEEEDLFTNNSFEGKIIYYLGFLHFFDPDSHSFTYDWGKKLTEAIVFLDGIRHDSLLSGIDVNLYRDLFEKAGYPFSEKERPSRSFREFLLRSMYNSVNDKGIYENPPEEKERLLTELLEEQAGCDRNYLYTYCICLQEDFTRFRKDSARLKNILRKLERKLDSLHIGRPEGSAAGLRGSVYYELGNLSREKSVKEKYYKKALADFGRSDRPDRRNDILEKYLRVRTDENQYYPQMPVRIHVSGKNLRRCAYTVFREKKDGSGYEPLPGKKRQKIVFGNRTGIPSDTVLQLSLSVPGSYKAVFRASGIRKSDPDYRQDEIYFNITTVGSIYRKRGDVPEIYVADLKTGRPLKKVRLEFFKENKEKKNDFPVKTDSLDLMLDGFTPVEAGIPDSGEYFIRAVKEDDRYSGLMRQFYIPDKKDGEQEPLTQEASLFTDRNLYRPGDTVRIKGVFYSYLKDRPDSIRTVSGIRKKIYLYRDGINGDSKITDSLLLETNEFGSGSGVFSLPADAATGAYAVKSGNAGRSFRVESYLERTFSVRIDDPDYFFSRGDTLAYKIHLIDNTGFPLCGEKFTYKAYLHNAYSPFYTLEEGTGVTGGNGTGQVKIRSLYSTQSIVLIISCIRATGEKKEFMTRAYIPQKTDRVLFESDLGDIVLADEKPSYYIRTYNQHGVDVPAQLRYFLISDKDTVLKGRMISTEPLRADWLSVPPGDYRFTVHVEGEKDVRTWNRNLLVIDTRRKGMSVRSRNLFLPVNPAAGDSLSFVFGSSMDDIFAEIELLAPDRTGEKLTPVLRKPVVLESGLHRISFPYPDSYPDKLLLSMSFVREGETYVNKAEYYRKKDRSGPLDISVSMPSDTIAPAAETEWIFTVRNARGQGTASEILLSVFDKTTQRYAGHSLRFPAPAYEPYIKYGTFRTAGSTNPYSNMPRSRSRTGFTLKEERRWKNNRYGAANFPGPVPVPRESIHGLEYEAVESESIPYMAGARELKKMKDRAQGAKPEPVVIREKLDETALFLPHIRTDSAGTAKICFRMPGRLGAFKVAVAAHTRGMERGSRDTVIICRKDLMVMPRFPVFIRRGDSPDLRALIVNRSDTCIRGEARIFLSAPDGLDMNRKYAAQSSPFKMEIPAKGSVSVKWKAHFPDTLQRIKIAAAFRGSTSDGEARSVPVYGNSREMTESVTRVSEKPGIFIVSVGGKASRKGIENSRYRWEAGDLLQMVVSALEENKKPDREADAGTGEGTESSLIETLWKYYIEKVSDKIGGQYPAQVKNLRKKEEGKGEELRTWMRFQNPDGGFCWFAGMPSSCEITLYVLEKIAMLQDMGAIVPDAELRTCLFNALRYIDEKFSDIRNGRKETALPVDYYYVRSFFLRDFPLSVKVRRSYSWAGNEIAKRWTDLAVLPKAMICTALLNQSPAENFSPEIAGMLRSLTEYAVEDEVYGISFPNAVLPYRGLLHSEIKAHTLLLNLFARTGQTRMSRGICRWLMMQKKTAQWKNVPATADAVYALVRQAQISGEAAGASYRIHSFSEGELKIEQLGKGVLFVNVFHIFNQKQTEEVRPSENGLKVEREYYKIVKGGGPGVRMRNETLLRLNASEPLNLKMGDELIVKYKITSPVIRSFVVLKTGRGACLAPASTLSGYVGWGGSGYYKEVRDHVTNYYFETLADGTVEITERFYVAHTGEFNTSAVAAECLYAPEFRGNTESGKIISADPEQ